MTSLSWRALVRHEYAAVAALILSVKLGLFLLPLFAFPLLGQEPPAQRGAAFLPTTWRHWDAHWYIQIAESGYQREGDARNGIVFFPLYPLLVRLVGFFTPGLFWAALLVANAASVAGLVLFFELARLEFGREAAWWSLVALALFPTAYFFNAPYTEGLFLLLSAGSFYAARRGRWLPAGIMGGLAAAARVTGVLLLPALALEFYVQRWERRGLVAWRRAAPLLLIPAALGVYLLFNQYLLGDPLAFRDVLRVRWYKTFAWPWVGLASRWRDIGSWPWVEYNILYGWAEFGAGVLLIAGTVWAYLKLRWPYVVYLALTTFVLLSTSWLLSTPRYVLSAFPLFFLIGPLLARYRTLAVVWTAGSVSLLTLLAVRYTHGWWAF
ncbi:MAG: hypothetical protein HY372_01950 [Candidatus Andersenbacteria bacterium]|nr:hypothetical protein [Candidatus Andersenbacteria bacterium]